MKSGYLFAASNPFGLSSRYATTWPSPSFTMRGSHAATLSRTDCAGGSSSADGSGEPEAAVIASSISFPDANVSGSA